MQSTIMVSECLRRWATKLIMSRDFTKSERNTHNSTSNKCTINPIQSKFSIHLRGGFRCREGQLQKSESEETPPPRTQQWRCWALRLRKGFASDDEYISSSQLRDGITTTGRRRRHPRQTRCHLNSFHDEMGFHHPRTNK